MDKRYSDFLSSFGLMVLGVGLLFVGSIRFVRVAESPKKVLPLAGPRESFNVALQTAALPVSRPAVPVLKENSDFKEDLSAKAALVVDNQTNTVLFKKNITEPRPLASITKLMSALVLNSLKLNWSSTTVVSSSDIDDSDHHLKVGERYTLDQLWHVALVGSSNSAVRALVSASGLSTEEFVNKMNEFAGKLHLDTARFFEPTGLDSRDMASALDTAKLLKEALNVPRIADTLQIGEYELAENPRQKPRQVWTTNWLLTNWVPNKFDPGYIVGKTGYIVDSGYNFVVRLGTKDNHSVRVVVLGTNSNEARFAEARDLGLWALTEYVWPGDPGYQELSSRDQLLTAAPENK